MTRAEAMGLRPSADSWAYRELEWPMSCTLPIWRDAFPLRKINTNQDASSQNLLGNRYIKDPDNGVLWVG